MYIYIHILQEIGCFIYYAKKKTRENQPKIDFRQISLK